MKAKDVGALVIGVGLIIFVVFFIFPVFGIEIANPFLPSTTAYVTIAPNVFLLWCDINPELTFVDFGTPRLSTISIVGEVQPVNFPTFILSDSIPAIPKEHTTVLPASFITPLASIPTCVGNPQGGADIGLILKIPGRNYVSPMKITWRYCCSGMLQQTFVFNYEKGVLYSWVLEVWNMRTNQLLYTVQGTQSFG